MKAVICFLCVALATGVVHGQAPSESPARDTASSPPATPPEPQPRGLWHVDFSLMNAFDGNVNHDVEPLRSYGISPAANLRYEWSDTLVSGYDVALNNYTGTDEWDRISQGVYALMTRRIGRLRLETGGDATWKGSSEDREVSNEFGVSERLVLRVSGSTRVALTGAYRYKQYPDDPQTSGLSPSLAGKIDQRFGDRRLTLGYKYQTRQSRAERDRYRRQTYSIAFSTPIDVTGDELSFELEYRPQIYQRLIRVGDDRVPRKDRRVRLTAVYERPLSGRADIVWVAGLEQRDSNDPDKRYTAPSLAMTVRYHWR